MKKLSLIVLISFLSLSTYAQEPTAPSGEATASSAPNQGIRGITTVGLEFGGERLLDVIYADGSKSEIHMGRGITINAGLIFPLYQTESMTYEGQVTAGVKWAGIKEATNADANLFRWPLEAVGFAKWNQFRAGAGLTYHIGNKFNGSGDLAPFTTSFDNALGFTILADYILSTNQFGFGLKYTSIKYKPTGVSGVDLDGSSFGFTATFFL